MDIQEVKIKVFAVGLGDVIFIETTYKNKEKRYFLIDTGASHAYSRYVNKIKSVTNQLSAIILTHKHGDHIANIKPLLDDNQIDIASIVMRTDDSDYASKANKILIDDITPTTDSAVNDKAKLILNPKDENSKKIINNWGFEVLYPAKEELPYKCDQNKNSIVLSMKVGKNIILFMGDAHKCVEKIIINRCKGNVLDWGKVKVVKVSHHGSDTASSRNFINKFIAPVDAIVSCWTSSSNPPNKQALNRWLVQEHHLYRTGNTNGENINWNIIVQADLSEPFVYKDDECISIDSLT